MPPQKQRFSLGRIVATPGALEALDRNGTHANALLMRHIAGDWGDLCAEDRRTNEHAITHGYRIMSSYTLKDGQNVWVITESDRYSTTLLLPEEY